MIFDVVVVGSLAYDDIKTPLGERKNLLGGSGTHFSIAASKFVKVACVGVVGDDFDSANIELFKNAGIDTTGINVVKGGKTFRWSGHYMDDINRAVTIDTKLNVFETFNPKIEQKLTSTRCCFLANSPPEVQLKVFSQINTADTLVVADTMNLWIDIAKKPLDELIGLVDILFINNDEVLQYTGEENIFSASKALLDKGLKAVVIKRGEYGSYLACKDNTFLLPSYPVEKVVDPTGAGDSFAGGFLGYLLSLETNLKSKDSIKFEHMSKALVYGTVVASFTVSAFGSESLIDLSRSEFDSRYNDLYHLTSFPPLSSQ